MGFVAMQRKAAVIVEDDCEASFAKRQCLSEISEDSFSESAAIALMALKKQSNSIFVCEKFLIESDQSSPTSLNLPCFVLRETCSKLLTPTGQDSTYANTVSSKKRLHVGQSDHHELTKNATIQPRLFRPSLARAPPSICWVKVGIEVSGRPMPMPPAPRLPNRIMSAPVGRKVTAKAESRGK